MQQKEFRTNSIQNFQQGPKGHILQQVFQGEVLTSHCFVLCKLLETHTSRNDAVLLEIHTLHMVYVTCWIR